MTKEKLPSKNGRGKRAEDQKEQVLDPQMEAEQEAKGPKQSKEEEMRLGIGSGAIPLEEKMMAKDPEQIRRLLNRLRRIEGQVRGIHQMVEEDRYCIDIMDQILAARSALENLGLLLMEHHVSHCLVHAIENGHAKESVQEILTLMRRFS